jgi:hypothetical protein
MNWKIEAFKEGTWITLDTFGDGQPVSLNYRQDDIKELSTKKKNPFSKTIELPGTPKNKLFFDNVSEVSINLDDINIKRALPCRIIAGNSAEVFRGNLILIEIDKKHELPKFLVTITGTIKSLDIELDGCELPDLIELDKYNHLRTIENQVASMDYTVRINNVLTQAQSGEGYVYPYIINGNTTDVYHYSYYYDLYPAVYAKTIWDAIFNKSGRTYTSNFINSDYFKKLIVPFGGDKIQLTEEDVLNKTTRVGVEPGVGGFENQVGVNGAVAMTPMRLPTSTWYYSNNDNYFLPLLKETGQTGNIEFTDTGNQFNANLFTTGIGGYYDIKLQLYFYPRFFLTDPGGSGPMRWTGDSSIQWIWQLQKVSTSGQVTTLDSITTNEFTPSNENNQPITWNDTQAGIDFDLQIATEVSNIWLNPGEVIRLRFGFRPRGGFKWQYSGVLLAKETVGTRIMLLPSRGNDISYFEVKPTNNDSLGGEDIKLRTTLPRMKCIDFITDISKLFNLVMVDDPLNENNMIIEPADDYYASGGEVKDWNHKIDMESWNIKPMSEIDFKDYLYKYDRDNDWYNAEYTNETGREWGDKSISLLNNFSKKENAMNIKFAPTPNADQFLMPPKQAPFFINDKFEKKSVKPRLLFYDGLKTPGDLRLRNQPVNPTDTVITGYPYCGMWDDPLFPTEDLSFDTPDKYYFNSINDQYPFNNLFNKFHRRTFNNIADPNAKLLTGYFALTPLDMKTFDYRDIIFLFDQYWRVNLIEDYDPTREKLTKVELYKVIDIKTNVPLRGKIPTANNLCPSDIIRIRVNRRFQYVSASGQVITEDCCKSIGGNFINGVCQVPWALDGTIGTPVPGTPGTGGPIRPIVDKLKSMNVDHNTKGNPKNIIIGENNYQAPGTKGVILGTNNIQSKSGTIIIGDNLGTDEEGIIYLPESQINSNGEIIKKYNKVEGGKDIVRPLFSKNPEWNLIRSGKDCVRELDYVSVYNVISGNDSKRIGYPE